MPGSGGLQVLVLLQENVKVSERFLSYECSGGPAGGTVKTRAAVLMQQPGEWEIVRRVREPFYHCV
jgi:hypothetical protein